MSRLDFCKADRLKFCKDMRKKYPEFPSIEVDIPSFVKVGKNVTIKKGCTIGTQGFGHERDGNKILHTPHIGGLVIEDDVTIHELTNVSRGTIHDTIIGKGTKIDVLVHVGHNVKIGRTCLITSGVVLGGSCQIGDNNWIGMNATIRNWVTIGNNCVIGMGAVVTKNVPDGQVWAGVPAVYIRDNPGNYNGE